MNIPDKEAIEHARLDAAERYDEEREETEYIKRETTFCHKCHMNVWNTRIEHHRTWCNPDLTEE